jgi:hypothetical protein
MRGSKTTKFCYRATKASCPSTTLRDRAVDLESTLVEAKTIAAKDIAALEVRVISAKSRVLDEAATGEKRIVNFKMELVKDREELSMVYEHNVQSIGGLCSPMREGVPTVVDYVRWLTVEVTSLLEVFSSVN